jgi:hypothetical protein
LLFCVSRSSTEELGEDRVILPALPRRHPDEELYKYLRESFTQLKRAQGKEFKVRRAA